MKSKFLQVLMFLLVLTLVACNSNSSKNEESNTENENVDLDGEIRIAWNGQPPVLDPHISISDIIANTMRHVYDTLLTIDSEYNVKPSLADSWEVSEDGKTYTFKLREGVTFHNGKELTSEDAVASMNRWKDSLGSRGVFADATFEEVDKYTLELRLPEPLSVALTVLAYSNGGFAAIMPKEVIENAPEEGINEHIGTGPFQFVEWKQDQYIHLTRYDDYVPREEPADGLFGKKEALVKDLRYFFVPDASTREAGILSGEYDFAHAIPYDSAERLEESDGVVNYTYPGAFLSLHFNKKQGIFQEKEARQGVAKMLELESILKAGYVDPKYYILNHNTMMEYQHTQWYSDAGKDKYNINDPEQGMELLKEAGYDGEELTLLTTRDYDDQYHGAVVIKEQLEQAGVKVNLEIYDWPTLLGKVYEEDAYDMFLMANSIVAEPSSSPYFNPDYSGWPNDPEMDELRMEFRGKMTKEEAMPVYDELQEWLYDYVPAVKIGDYNRVSSARDTIENFQYLDGVIFWNVTKSE